MHSPIVWITGANGLIGSHLIRAASRHSPNIGDSPVTVRPLTRQELDLLDTASVRNLFRKENPAAVIHCAAMSKSPACQADPALARRVNVEVTAVLVDLAAHVPFCFFGTDLVFDGRLGNYEESASPNPLSVYGETKAEAERIVLTNPLHTVIRTSLNGGDSPTGDRGFNEDIRLAWKQGRTLNLFVDEYRSPIPASVTARVVWELLAQKRSGLYHIAGAERLSRFQMGRLLAERWPQLNPCIEPGSLKDYHGAPRAPDTSLKCDKVQKLLSFPMPRLSEWLQQNPDEVF